MPGTGTRTFIDADRYEAGLYLARIAASITPLSAFRARLTWAELCHVLILRGEEELPRIGYLRLPPQLVFIAFAHSGEMPVWCGAGLPPGGVVLHRSGEWFHQAISGPTGWSMLAIDREWLLRAAQSLLGRPLVLPAHTVLLLPPMHRTGQLRRLHAQICRLAETKPKILTHREVAHALEQGLIEVLVTLLNDSKRGEGATTKTRHARIMESFEQVLTAHSDGQLVMRELCQFIGVSERVLRSCCQQMLGISPMRYARLRRLKQVRLALRDGDPDTISVSSLAARYGFTEPKRFALQYRAIFGESPSTTLHRSPVRSSGPSSIFAESA